MASPCLIVAWSGTAPCAWGRNSGYVLEKPWQEQKQRRTASRKIEYYRTSGCRKNVWTVPDSSTIGHRRKQVYVEARTIGGSDEVSMAAEEGHRVSLPSNVDYISSVGNSYVKHLVRLRRSAATRQSTFSVLVMGSIPLREICESVEFDGKVQGGLRMINVLLVREDAGTSEGLTRFSQRVVRVSVAVMSKITGLDSPPDAMGVLSYPSSFTSFERHQDKPSGQLQKWCPSPRRILILDAIQDPGNLGTLIRTAAAFAWDGLFLLPGCCDPFNEKALRAARGASFRIPIAVGEWHHVKELAASNSMKLYAGEPGPVSESGEADSRTRGKRIPGHGAGEKGNGFSVDGISLDIDADIGTKLKPVMSDQGGLCLVLGSEGQGLSHKIVQDCIPVGIPMPGKFESLNVAVAGGILMFLLK